MGFQYSYRDGWVWRDDGTTAVPNYDYSYLTTYEIATPPREGWICPRCGRVNAPWVSQCDCSGNIYKKIDIWSPSGIPEACRSCSNHPSNGGSGICHCTLGMIKITC